MPKIVILKGLPASGKSTRATQLVNCGYKRINNDDLRDMIDGYKFTKENEEYITILRQSMISLFMGAGKNIVIDNTNLNPKCRKEVEQIIENISKQVGEELDYIIEEEFIDTPLAECLMRDARRTGRHHVGSKVINDMYDRYLKPKPVERNTELQDIIIVDIDGTVAQKGDRDIFDFMKVHLDTVIEPVAHIVRNYLDLGYKVVFVSGRDEECRGVTEKWLVDNGLYGGVLHMRRHKDNRDDRIVKQEIYEEHIKDKFNVLFILDDRDKVVKMWRSLGLTCLQCQEGNF